ncbi:MAG TPA: ATPase, T2SS/T4P/T4SS family [Solirubrobacteraceae bacterium]|nr:ATPase, T2SS/T4P/T4SS family [Solirubrobacteraceae bacterium]
MGTEIRSSAGSPPPSRRLRFIGDVIVDLGYADREAVDAAVAQARESGRRTGEVLLENGTLTADQLARVVAERFGVEYVDLNGIDADMTAANLISASAARRYEAVPVRFIDDRTLLVVMVDPGNVLAIDDLAILTSFDIRPAVAPKEDVAALITRLNSLTDVVVEEVVDDDATEITDLRETDDDAPVIKLVHSLIAQGVERGASDLHFEPGAGGEMVVRYRVDGVLTEATRIPRRLVPGVVSRIKIMSDLDIAERRHPQDGRVALTIDGRHIDVRVATLPLVSGEAAVLRVLDKDGGVIDLDKLGMVEPELRAFARAFSKPHGAVLVTGPTGSGKTTTLYGALQRLHTPDKNIITIEDPVEYQLDGIKQMQINPKVGVTFATGLRSMMRADPDVIMVGEVRDKDTAQIAVEAALTGHLVLSTLHTNDAPTAIARLIEMGVEPFLVASAVDCVVAQRLARTLCDHCKTPVKVDGKVVREHGFDVPDKHVEAFEPAGCARCGGSGYKGRIGIYEVMVVDERIRHLAVSRATADEIAAVAEDNGMRRLREEGLAKVRAGLTSFAEIARVTA